MEDGGGAAAVGPEFGAFTGIVLLYEVTNLVTLSVRSGGGRMIEIIEEETEVCT